LKAGALQASPGRLMSDALHPSDYERSDADPRLIGALALGVAAFLAVTPFLLLAIYPGSGHATRISEQRAPPEPRLQVAPKADLERLRITERAQLESYGWVDRDRGITHIPIERAMTLLGDRGLPGWSAPEPASR
jgi:hypothetical protein